MAGSYWVGMVVGVTVLGLTSLGWGKEQKQQATQAQGAAGYGTLPLTFEANRGQVEQPVKYLARGNGYILYLTPTEVVMQLQSADFGLRNNEPLVFSAHPQSTIINPQAAVVRMQMVGTKTDVAVVGEAAQSGKVHYLRGADRQQWRTHIPTYGRVRYRDLYAGIDLVYYSSAQGQMEYDFEVAPGADPRQIALSFTGVQQLRVDAQGDLLLDIGGKTLRQRKPWVYQEVGGARKTVEGRYAVGGKERVEFAVGAYDATRPLIIDPVLDYSTYLGGSTHDGGFGIAVDSANRAYVTGRTNSVDFPTANALQETLDGNSDVLVARLSADGGTLEYATYLGGSAG
ncbi:MAG: SBBP repeat-containing protein, partial [Candidatus Binatia bacterium]